MTNVIHKFFSMCLFLFITIYTFRAQSVHHQERQIVPIQPLVTVILCWWPRCVLHVVIYQESLHDARSTKCKKNRKNLLTLIHFYMLNKQESLKTVKNLKLKLLESNVITWYNKICTAKQLAPKKGCYK